MKLAILGAVAACAVAAPASADVVSDWAELQTIADRAESDPMAPFDPAKISAYGRLTLAMFEAANAADPRYRSYLGIERAPRGASVDAAVASAAHAVLTNLYAGQKKSLDDALTLALGNVPEGKAKADGVALGKRAAEEALKRGGWDDKARLSYYRPTGPAGRWAPSNVPFPAEMSAGRPWFLTSLTQFRIAEPPPLASGAWAASFNEVKKIGARESKARTPAETIKARFWAFYELDPVLRQIASQPGRSVVRNARMYAQWAMAADDMDFVMAEGKLHHMFWRPINAIRTADSDGNDATEAEPGWVPLLNTPNQPEYPCGHCMFANLTATVLAAEGPPPPGGYAFTTERMPGVRITVPDLATYAREVSYSRILAGVHFRMTNDISDDLGRRLALHAMERFAPPL
ncbi:vanadium-dependent haloperoxidase [Tsuneonella sp. HG249]